MAVHFSYGEQGANEYTEQLKGLLGYLNSEILWLEIHRRGNYGEKRPEHAYA